MSTEEMIKELRRLADIEKSKPHYTGNVRWDVLCTDTANSLEQSNKDFNLLLQGIKEIYPRDKCEYMELDVFMGQIMLYVANNRNQN